MNGFLAEQNAAVSKEGLLEFLNGHMGYPVNGFHYTTLNFLIQTEQDLTDFFKFFDGDWDNRSLMMSIAKLEQHKIKNSRLTWEDFSDIFSFDPQDALETLFMSECPQWQINMLYDKLKQGLTLRHVYDTALKPEGHNYLWGYVSRDWDNQLVS